MRGTREADGMACRRMTALNDDGAADLSRSVRVETIMPSLSLSRQAIVKERVSIPGAQLQEAGRTHGC